MYQTVFVSENRGIQSPDPDRRQLSKGFNQLQVSFSFHLFVFTFVQWGNFISFLFCEIFYVWMYGCVWAEGYWVQDQDRFVYIQGSDQKADKLRDHVNTKEK